MNEPNPNPQARILLVDDFELIRHMLRSGLQNIGFKRVDEAATGDDALSMLKAAFKNGDPYTFIFCDWNMPERSGLAVLQECQRIDELRSIPFVMVTAESGQEKVVEALKAGATDYIVKPISHEALQKKVFRLLNNLKV